MAGTKVRKTFGVFPEKIVVLSEMVEFDGEGIAEVENEDIVDTLSRIPGYEVVSEEDKEAEKTPVTKKEEPKKEAKPSEEEDKKEEPKKAEKKEAPKKTAPRKPSPLKPKK